MNKRFVVVILMLIVSTMLISCTGKEVQGNNEQVSNANEESQKEYVTDKSNEVGILDKSSDVDILDKKQFSMVGTINSNLNIHMKLEFNKKEVTGTYYYDKYKIDLNLRGTYDEGNNVNMNEFDEKGNITGIFNGKISVNGDFNGIWSVPDGSRKLLFDIKAISANQEDSTTTSSSSDTKKESTSTSMKGQDSEDYNHIDTQKGTIDTEESPFKESIEDRTQRHIEERNEEDHKEIQDFWNQRGTTIN